jgi:SAM-dependent methyltransferase
MHDVDLPTERPHRARVDEPGSPDDALPSREHVEVWARAYLRQAPLSLCLRELNRLIAIHVIDALDEASGARRDPVLDVGCGDGFWWTLRDTRGRTVHGIDISAREIDQAKKRIQASRADVSQEIPVRGPFDQIIGNCSLEHVRQIDAALRNLRSVAADDGRLVLFVPAPQWAYQGVVQSFLLARAPRLAMAAAGAMNGFFQHWHLYELPVWQQILAQNGWRVSFARGLGSPRSEFLFRLFLPPSFLAFVVKQFIGVYPSKLLRLVPDRALTPLARLMSWALSDPLVAADSPHAYEYLIVAETADLPAPPPGV